MIKVINISIFGATNRNGINRRRQLITERRRLTVLLELVTRSNLYLITYVVLLVEHQ
jgi:hypothetical protein